MVRSLSIGLSGKSRGPYLSCSRLFQSGRRLLQSRSGCFYIIQQKHIFSKESRLIRNKKSALHVYPAPLRGEIYLRSRIFSPREAFRRVRASDAFAYTLCNALRLIKTANPIPTRMQGNRHCEERRGKGDTKIGDIIGNEISHDDTKLWDTPVLTAVHDCPRDRIIIGKRRQKPVEREPGSAGEACSSLRYLLCAGRERAA